MYANIDLNINCKTNKPLNQSNQITRIKNHLLCSQAQGVHLSASLFLFQTLSIISRLWSLTLDKQTVTLLSLHTEIKNAPLFMIFSK